MTVTSIESIKEIQAEWRSNQWATSKDVAKKLGVSVYIAQEYSPFPRYGMNTFVHSQIANHMDLYRSMSVVDRTVSTPWSFDQIRRVHRRIRKIGGIEKARDFPKPRSVGTWSPPAAETVIAPERVAAPEKQTPYTPREPASMKEQLEIKLNGNGKPVIGIRAQDSLPHNLVSQLIGALRQRFNQLGDEGWETADWSGIYTAGLQHLLYWHERTDDGTDHLLHAIAVLSLLLANEQSSRGVDDRPKKGGE